MRTQKIKLYNINELSKEVKETVIEKFRNREGMIELEPFSESVIEELKTRGWGDVKIQYSLGCCQGDGLSFIGKLDLHWFLSNIYSKKLPKDKIWAICEYIYQVKALGNTGHYNYAHKDQIKFELNYQDNWERPNLDKLWEDVLNEIKSFYMDLCAKYETEGYDEIDHQLSDEYITDFLLSNDYEFLEDGKCF